MKKLIKFKKPKNNVLMRILILFVSILSVTSCATYNNLKPKEKTYALAASGALLGILVGQSIGTTPQTRTNLTYMGTGLGASTGFIIGLNLYDFEPPTTRTEQEYLGMELKIKEFEKQMNLELISKGTTDSAKTPPELKEYLKKGKWERYKLQRWNQDPEDENIFYKVTEQIKLIPKEGEE